MLLSSTYYPFTNYQNYRIQDDNNEDRLSCIIYKNYKNYFIEVCVIINAAVLAFMLLLDLEGMSTRMYILRYFAVLN